MKAVLVQAPAWSTVYPPYGLAVLKSALEQQGHRIKTFDLNLQLRKDAPWVLDENWSLLNFDFWTDARSVEGLLLGERRAWLDACVKQVVAEGARVVGFTVVITNEHASLLLAKKIKEADPGCLIVLGGPQAGKLASGRRLAAMAPVDFIIDGEGEETLAEFLAVLERGGDPASCPGLLYRKDGQVVESPARPLARDLAAFPYADYSDFDLSAYDDAGCIPISLSRGCPNQCTFCYEVQYWDRFRIRKSDAVVEEMHKQKARWPAFEFFFFHDSLVNGNMGQLKSFADAAAGQDALKWSAMSVIRKEMTPDVLRGLQRAGCVCLTYGLETASMELMLATGKVLARGSDPARIIRDTREAGVGTSLNFMFGLPGETEAHHRETLAFVRANKDCISSVNPSSVLCVISEGTTLRVDPGAHGIELTPKALHWSSTDGTNDLPTRIARFERFLDLVHELGIPCTYPYRVFYRKNALLGEYWLAKGEDAKASALLERALETDPHACKTAELLNTCRTRAGRPVPRREGPLPEDEGARRFKTVFLLSQPLVRRALEAADDARPDAGFFGRAAAAIEARLRESGDDSLAQLWSRLRRQDRGDDPFAIPAAWPSGVSIARQVRILRAVCEHVRELLPEGAPALLDLEREVAVMSGKQERRASVLRDLIGTLAAARGKKGRALLLSPEEDGSLVGAQAPDTSAIAVGSDGRVREALASRGGPFEVVILFNTFALIPAPERSKVLSELAGRTAAGGWLFVVDETAGTARQKDVARLHGEIAEPMEASGWGRTRGPYFKDLARSRVSIVAGNRR